MKLYKFLLSSPKSDNPKNTKVPIRGKILPLNYRFSGFSGKLAIGRINRVENARGPMPESAFAAIPVTFKRRSVLDDLGA